MRNKKFKKGEIKEAEIMKKDFKKLKEEELLEVLGGNSPEYISLFGDGFVDLISEIITMIGFLQKNKANVETVLKRAKEIKEEHSDWTTERIVEEIKKEFSMG